jgi:iron complex outermembrane receptor protein
MHRLCLARRVWPIAAMSLLLTWSSEGRAQKKSEPAADLTDADQGGEAAPSGEDAMGPLDEPEQKPAAEQGEGGGEAAPEAAAEAPVEAEPEPAVEKTPPPSPAGDSNEIIVTGSRLKHTSFAQPSAVQVVDRQQLQLSGADNMADVIKYMNINSGSEFNADVSGGSSGTAQFNLRGLGLNSTLVLLNGRRLVESAALATDGTNFVDINSLPLPMVERIEVLKGGASAIYGSDAVAGVVNVITRKNYDGFEAQAGGQTTDRFDQHEWDVSLVGGAKSEHTRVMGMLSYFKREPLYSTDRAFTNNGKNVSNIGWPGTFLPVNGVGMPVAKGIQDPGCGKVPLSAPTTDPMAALPFCTFNFNSYYMLVLDEQRVNTYTTIEHDISDHTTVFMEGGFARDNSNRILSPSFPILQPIYVPADNAYNPTGQRLRVYARLLGGNSPPQHQYFESDTLHTVAGIKGDLGGLSDGKLGEWEWELSGTYSNNRYSSTLPDQLKNPFQTALNSCNPMSDPANCLNIFAAGAPNSQAIIDRVTGQLTVVGVSEMTTANAEVSGPIVELPGGDLSLALGTQIRRETGKSDSDHDANQLDYLFLVGGPDFSAERRIFAGYGELSMPFVRGLETQAAGRIENYSDVGSTFNPMFGASWTPATTFMGDEASAVSKARLRGTFANSFRAPSLLQSGGAQTALLPIHATSVDPMMPNNPLSPAGTVYTPVRTLGNPNLSPQTSTAVTGGVEWSPVKGLTLLGDYWHYDYRQIIIKQDPQQVVDADFKAGSPLNPLGNPAVHRDPGSRTIQQVDTQFINASSVMTHGIDIELAYRSDFFGPSAGLFGVGASASYVFAYEIPYDQASAANRTFADANCSQASGTCDVAGLRNATNFARPIPRLRVTVPLSWHLSGHTAAVIGHFIGGYKNDEAQSPPLMSFVGVNPFFSLDLQYAYRFDEGGGKGTTLKVGVLNVTDAFPPTVNTALGYDTQTHDPRGRMIYARVMQEM